MSGPSNNAPSFVDELIDQALGRLAWIRSVLLGQFEPEKPLSAVLAEMLVNFIPGVVIITSARDAVAIVIRMAKHPEKRDDPLEWIYLCACIIVIALPLVMAAGGLAFAGVGAVVGGIAGTELGAVLKAVMVLLMKETRKLVEVLQFLQKFMKGDVQKFLRLIKFAEFEKAILTVLNATAKKLIDICAGLRVRLQTTNFVNDFDEVKLIIQKLIEWERQFYAVQNSAVKAVPLAIAELDRRLVKLLAELAPKEIQTAVTAVKANAPVVQAIKPQRVFDSAGNAIRQGNPVPAASAKASSKTVPAGKPKAEPKIAAKTSPKVAAKVDDGGAIKHRADPIKKVEEGPNTKKQLTAQVDDVVELTPRTVLSGHGEWRARNGNMVIPKGTTFTVYSEHGATISDDLGNVIETGGDVSKVYSKTYLSGDKIPNYTLQPPTGLNIIGDGQTVVRNTNLASLLKPNMGDVHWAACTYVDNVPVNTLLYHTDGVIETLGLDSDLLWTYVKTY